MGIVNLTDNIDTVTLNSDYFDPLGDYTSATVNALGGDDVITAAMFSLTVNGGDGNDTITASEGGAHFLNGDAGDDTLSSTDPASLPSGQTANDTLAGGTGDDTFIVFDASVTLIENADEGIDTVKTGLSEFTLQDNFENLTGTATASQVLTGNSANNVITGGTGADSLYGLDGNDEIHGGNNDTYYGGVGDDTYFVNGAVTAATPFIVELADEGVDTVVLTGVAQGSLANLDFVENLTVQQTATANVGGSLTGNALNNVITGAAGAEKIDGGAGADTMAGGRGSDHYYVDDAGDQVTEVADGGAADEVTTSLISYTLGDFVENLSTDSAVTVTFHGNSLNNMISGGKGGDTLFGHAGDDTLAGGKGGDTLNGGNGSDTADYSGGGGMTVALNGSVANGGAAVGDVLVSIENLIGSSTGVDQLIGNSAANTLAGLAGSDTLNGMGGIDNLDGGKGNDKLDGGRGIDLLTGGAGNDRFIFNTVGESGDHIADFATGDRIVLSSAGFGHHGTGMLDASMFHSGSTIGGGDANDYFKFRTTDGTLWYDADGNKAGAAKLIADLDNHYHVSASDIILI